MRKLLTLSLLLNAGFLAFLFCGGLPQPRHRGEPARGDTVVAAPVVSGAPASGAARQRLEPGGGGFHWSEIESPDLPVYLANLRRIGCPERIVRDLQVTEIGRVYATKRASLRGEAKRGALSEAAARRAFATLDRAEADEIAAVVGPPEERGESTFAAAAPRALNAPSLAAESASPAAVALVQDFPSHPPRPGAAALLPLALFPPATGLVLSEAQAAAWAGLREAFVQSLGGPGGNPADPEYARRWRSAQPAADARLWTLLGQEAYGLQLAERSRAE